MNIAQFSKQFNANLEHFNTTVEQVLTLVFTELGDSHLPEVAQRYSSAAQTGGIETSTSMEAINNTHGAQDSANPQKPLKH